MNTAMAIALMFVPPIVILWLANLADRRRSEGQTHRALAVLAHGSLILFYSLSILIGTLLFAAGRSPAPLPPASAEAYRQMGIDAAHIKPTLASIGLGLWLPPLVGIILLLRPVRRLLAHLIPIDPASTVHAVALSFSTLVVTNLLLTLSIGLGNLASAMQTSAQGSRYNAMLAIWTQDVVLVFMALLGVGWLSRRSLSQVLQRLGLTVPKPRQAALGLGVGLVLAPIVLLIEQFAAKAGISAGADVDKLTEALIGPLFHSLPGLLTLGLAAALGEESIFRGALQPRFGLLLTAVLFALLHSNYGLSIATLVVLGLGIVLGLVRQRANTTTSMIAHAVYNISVGLAAYWHLF